MKINVRKNLKSDYTVSQIFSFFWKNMEQKVGSAFIEIEAKLDQLEGRLSTEIQSLWAKAGSSFSDWFQQSIQGLGTAITSIISLGAIKQLWGEILGLANNLQQSHIAFTTMLWSAEASENLLSELSEFASKTPFELQGVRENAKQLLAMGVSTQELLPTLKSLGDVSAGLSIPLERLALNYGQVMTQWKLTGREMRDFMMAGVPLADELAKNLGVAKEKIWDMISAGQISAEEVKKAFQTMSSEWGKFADMMWQQAQSLGGLMSNLNDEIGLTGEAIGKEFLPMASSIVSAISGVVEKIREWVQEHPTATKAIVSFVAIWGGALALLWTIIPMLWTVAVAFGAISRPVLAVVGAIAALTAGGIAYYDYAEEQRIQNKYLGESYTDLKKRQDELKETQEKLTKSYEEGILTQEEYESKQKELKKESEDLKKAQDSVQISLEEVRSEMEKIKNSNLNVSDKIARLEELRKKAMQTENALNETLKRLKELWAKIKQEQKEEQEWLRTEIWAGGAISQTQTLYRIEKLNTQQAQQDLLWMKKAIKDVENEIDWLNKTTDKNKLLWSGWGGWKSSNKAEKEALKEVKESYTEIEKKIKEHSKAVEDAEKKVENLNKKYNELKETAKKAFYEAKQAVSELDQEIEKSDVERSVDLWARYQDIQRQLKEERAKLKEDGKDRMIEQYDKKALQEYQDKGYHKLYDIEVKKLLEIQDLLAERALIEKNTTEAQRKSQDFTEQTSKAQEILNKHAEKTKELEEKKAIAIEKQAIAKALSEGKKIEGKEEDGELKARYEDETGKMVEVTNFKNIQYAQDLFNKSESIRLEKEEVEKKLLRETAATQNLINEKIRLDQEYTKVHNKEIDKQKGKVDELIAKYQALAKAKFGGWGARGARAFGGAVQAGLPYLIGENYKPEMFIPSTSGSVVPVNNYNQSRTYHFSGVTINANNAQDFWSEIQNHIGDYT